MLMRYLGGRSSVFSGSFVEYGYCKVGKIETTSKRLKGMTHRDVDFAFM